MLNRVGSVTNPIFYFGGIMDNKLLEALARIESDGWQYALRFEPATYLRKLLFDKTIIQKIIKSNKCSKETAFAIYSTSYGAWQLMGFNIYNNNCDVSVGEYLSNSSLQEQSVGVYLKQRGLENTTIQDLLDEKVRNNFARKYNGPGNVPEYSSRLLTSIQKTLHEASDENDKKDTPKAP